MLSSEMYYSQEKEQKVSLAVFLVAKNKDLTTIHNNQLGLTMKFFEHSTDRDYKRIYNPKKVQF